MHVEEPEEPYKPELQLQYAGGGPGSRGKTAVGTDEFGQPLDRTRLPNAPWWFIPFGMWRLKSHRELFASFELKKAMFILNQQGVPPLYRLGVGLRLGFIDPERDNFTQDDFEALLIVDPSNDYWSDDDLSKELDKIELAVVFHLGLNFSKYLSEQNSYRFELEWGVSPGD